MVKKIQKTIYYAHSMRIYNSEREKEELRFLRSIFRKVICPNHDMKNLPSPTNDTEAMLPYLKKVDKCDGVVCSEFNGYIGKGVYEEIKRAMPNFSIPLCLREESEKYKFFIIEELDLVGDDNWTAYARLKVSNKEIK